MCLRQCRGLEQGRKADWVHDGASSAQDHHNAPLLFRLPSAEHPLRRQSLNSIVAAISQILLSIEYFHARFESAFPSFPTPSRTFPRKMSAQAQDLKKTSDSQAAGPSTISAAQQSDNVAHALAGAGGGLLSMALTYPLITLSTRAQVESKRAQSSTLDAAKRIIQREGVSGLYAGLESALFGISVTNFVYYYWYEWTRAGFEKAAIKAGRASKKLTTVESMIAGAIAGSATVLITNPIWVVNTRMTARKSESNEQLPGSKPAKAPSTIGTLLTMIKEEGFMRLFAGVVPALVLVINPILQYTFFEQLKNVLEKRRRVTPTDSFYLGAMGKLLATSITYPYITVKSRMHVAGKDGPKEDMMTSFRRIVKEEGWAGLYGGIGPKVTQSVITAAFLFAFKDALYDMTVKARRAAVKK